MAKRAIQKLARCGNCGKRIFLERHGKYALAVWHHFGYAQRECDGLVAKYATPSEGDA